MANRAGASKAMTPPCHKLSHRSHNLGGIFQGETGAHSKNNIRLLWKHITRGTKCLPNNPLHSVPPDSPPNLPMDTDSQPIERIVIIYKNKGKALAMKSLPLTVDMLILPPLANKMAFRQPLAGQFCFPFMQKDACALWPDGHG